MHGAHEGTRLFFMLRVAVANLLVAMTKLLQRLQMCELRSIKLVGSGL